METMLLLSSLSLHSLGNRLMQSNGLRSCGDSARAFHPESPIISLRGHASARALWCTSGGAFVGAVLLRFFGFGVAIVVPSGVRGQASSIFGLPPLPPPFGEGNGWQLTGMDPLARLVGSQSVEVGGFCLFGGSKRFSLCWLSLYHGYTGIDLVRSALRFYPGWATNSGKSNTRSFTKRVSFFKQSHFFEQFPQGVARLGWLFKGRLDLEVE
ncbi:hypothetical protein GOP47_0011795 [Adiantum capillus-veneris]|uniref:Uncharacterized protein n=1 Tax=Adiantum capillus-veneris TaxID=13818 RepID=A0A9D4UUT6_ADICA|nr:hypothetical protein GOP47_0011795 [Adiantum capillus-veneris]